MTVQIDEDGPLVEDWRSAKFEATVNGTPVYCFGRAELSNLGIVDVWDAGDTVEVSWVLVNTDEDITVAITLADATPITSANVYPRNAGFTQTIAGGVLTLTSVPPNTRLRVEVNGDRVDCMHVFTAPPITAPVGNTNYTSLGAVITAINTTDGSTTFTCDDGHGLSDGQRVIIKSTGDRPSTDDGELPEHEIVYAFVTNANDFQLGTTAAGVDIVTTDIGSGTITVTRADWASGSALYFPAGVHVIGRQFNLTTGANLWLDAGAVVVGTFDVKANGIVVGGRGTLSGSGHNYYTEVSGQPFQVQRQFAMFDGIENASTPYSVTVSGIVITACPFFVNFWGVSTFENVHHLAPWHGGCDGLAPFSADSVDKTGRITDCFSFAGDNTFKVGLYGTNTICTGSFAVTAQAACFQLGYRPTHDDSFASTIENCHAMHLGEADVGSAGTVVSGTPEFGQTSIIHASLDGYEADSALGVFGLTLSGLRVWGPLASRMLFCGNTPYLSFGAQYDEAGQLADWSVSDVVTEFVPGQTSQILGRDADNAPRNLTFTGIRLGTVDIDEGNYDTYFEVSPFATNIVWDAVPVEEVILTDAETLWAYVKSVYDSDGLVSLTNIRDRSATSISDLVGEAASASVINLWPSYAQSSFDVTDAVHLETAVEGVIAMLWRRGGSSTTIEQVKWDTVFGEGGTIEKLRRTSSRGRRGPSSNSRTITSTTTVRLYGWSDPASLPPGYLPRGSGMGTDS